MSAAKGRKSEAVKAWLVLANHFIRETNALDALLYECDCPRAPGAGCWDCDCGIADGLGDALDDVSRRVMAALLERAPYLLDDDEVTDTGALREVDNLVGPETAHPDDTVD